MSPRLRRGDPQHVERLQALAAAFRPAAPIDRRALFSGRTRQLGDLIGVVDQPGQHAIVYGERGVGKTSLITVAAEVLGAADVLTVRTTCDRSDDFASVWRKALGEIGFTVRRPGVGFSGAERESRTPASAFLGDEATPHAVRRGLQALTGERRVVVFFDEFDRLGSGDARLLFADTIKTLSDQLAAATIVLVGVADDVEQLIEEHQSVERAVAQVHMPRMSPDELGAIVTRGMEAAGLTIEREGVETIARVAQGLPHYAHLLAQLAGRVALEDLRTRVRMRDVEEAVREAAERTQHSVLEAYRRAIEHDGEIAPTVVLACALAPADEYGFFDVDGVRDPLRAIRDADIDDDAFARQLDELAGTEQGSVLQKRGSAGAARYRFANPLLQPYVVMRGLAEGTVAPEVLRAT